MVKKKKPGKPVKAPSKKKPPEIKPPLDPEEPLNSGEDPDLIIDEEEIEVPPYEPPEPGEGP